MFEYVRNNQRLVQIFLALITLPFAFWGVESYVRGAGSGDAAATVGESQISAQEFQNALREQQERLRPALGGRDPALLDSPEMRRSVLEGLIGQRLVAVQAKNARLAVSDDQLVRFIASAPSLQENGKFSPQRYEMLVASQGMSKEMFEARVRQDLAMQQALSAIGDAVLPGRTAADHWIGAQLEEREISEVLLRPEDYAAQVKLGPDAVKNYYEANRKRFEVPELVRAEFVVLSQDKLAAQAAATDEEIKAYYASHADRYKVPEERRASHILIMAAKNAPAADDAAARSRAEEALALVKKNPADFAKVAKEYSQDPGSAGRGGDLDWFGRGMMVPPFEQAVFGLREGEVSGVVRSDFGYHVIKLTGIRPERVKPLADVKGEIAEEMRRQGAAKKYAEMAEAFTNIVYEQADSLKPAAEKFKLEIRAAEGWMAKNGQAAPPFNNPKLAEALFSDDAIKNKRNTEAVEVAPNTLVAARVVEHKPATLQPLEAVTPAIEKHLVQQEAVKLAAKEGEEMRAKLAKGESVGLTWGAPRVVARSYAPNLAPEAIGAVFKADVATLPAYVGAATPGGYALYRISQVKRHVAGTDEPPRAKALREQYQRVVAEEEMAAWLATLRGRYPVEVNKAALEAKQ